MKTLLAPGRMAYLLNAKDENTPKSPAKTNCIFCEAGRAKIDASTLVLYQGKKSYVIMNKFPYSNGHLMVIPKRHLSDLSKLKSDEHAELGLLLGHATNILKKYGRCDGFNLGMNLGAAAGAGVKDHLHYHIVPRWNNDHNFMPVFADTRVVPELLHDTYRKLKPLFDKI
jgi:ATP adenylyltransferase